MRSFLVALVIGTLLLCCAGPAMAAGNQERYSYITVRDVTMQLGNGTAQISVNYSVDEPTRIIFFLLGKKDLREKLTKILNYENATINRIDLSSADLTVNNAAYSYGNGAYWYPSHKFNVEVPFLTISTPQYTLNLTNTRETPSQGMLILETQSKNK
jgi:hypothetical protein